MNVFSFLLVRTHGHTYTHNTPMKQMNKQKRIQPTHRIGVCGGQLNNSKFLFCPLLTLGLFLLLSVCSLLFLVVVCCLSVLHAHTQQQLSTSRQFYVSHRFRHNQQPNTMGQGLHLCFVPCCSILCSLLFIVCAQVCDVIGKIASPDSASTHNTTQQNTRLVVCSYWCVCVCRACACRRFWSGRFERCV